jgi:DNA-binding IclR family transcriptional regulator
MPKERNERHDIEYRLETLDRGLTVLEKLLEAPSRGYSTKDMERVTGLPYDFCKRALITFRLRGYAKRYMNGWKPGDKCRVLADRTDLGFTSQSQDVANLAESMRES